MTDTFAKKDISFKNRILFAVTIGNLLISIIYTVNSLNIQQAILYSELLKKAQITTQLAAKIGELPLITKNKALLEAEISELKTIPEISFIAFYDSTRTLIINKQQGILPDRSFDENYDKEALSIQEHLNLFDVLYPVFTSKAWEIPGVFDNMPQDTEKKELIGWVRIGFSKNFIQQAQRKLIITTSLISLGFSLIGIFILWQLLTIVTAPLTQLFTAAKNIKQGTYPNSLPVAFNDEIGMLTEEFNRMSDSIRERENMLNQKNNELKQFSYIVSHDLKSPLLTIRGFIGIIEKNIKKGSMESLPEYFNFIYSAVDHMHKLLHELIRVSKLEYTQFNNQIIELREMIQEIQTIFKLPLKQKNISLKISSELATVRGDSLRLREVFQNLIENSIKFMGQQPSRLIEIGIIKQEANNIYYVRDNGIGINPQYQKRIFNIFEQLDNKTEGAGIGLTIVKRIIELHKGRIWVESEEGKGSTFYFTLWETTTS
ncbi:MAG: HAMP domain-containing histidine kinase [Candidatus Omnitrophica bacterium]|nr:HAMP domain-containing histidine kinase [Candidatus Omnitrophota bacterium]